MSPTQRKLLTYGIPVVAALALFVYLRSRNSAPAPAASGTLPGTTAGDTAVGLGQLANFENSIGAAIAQMEGQINSIQSGTTTATPAPAPSAPMPSGPAVAAPTATLEGSGYFTGASSGSYSYISTHNQLTGIEAAGGTVYFEPVPGVFDPVPKNLAGLAPGTPLYASA